jgi:hypothetical protein
MDIKDNTHQGMMRMDVNIEPRSGYLYVCVSGEQDGSVPTEGQPSSLAKTCRDGNYRCLLIDVRESTEVAGSNMYYRYGEEIAKAFAFNVIRIAIAGRAEQSRSLSLIESVATNRGIILKSFTDMDKAIEWLTT